MLLWQQWSRLYPSTPQIVTISLEYIEEYKDSHPQLLQHTLTIGGPFYIPASSSLDPFEAERGKVLVNLKDSQENQVNESHRETLDSSTSQIADAPAGSSEEDGQKVKEENEALIPDSWVQGLSISWIV